MMLGDKQPEAGGGLASEATGACENCAILTRSLDEYMAALLTLKQKIIDTDRLLSEYKEKCDELQKSQRESSKLHKQLDDVLLKLGPLEQQTMDLESVKAELEEAKASLQSYKQKSEEVDQLREENSRTFDLNKKLKENLKMVEDAAKTQSLENAKLSSEKKTLEEDLQTTRDSLSMCQQTAAEEVENLRLQNAKTLILKSNLENQLLAFEDTKLKQNNHITDLKRENCILEENSRKMQEKLLKLEKELKKEKRSMSTQTKLEPTVDRAKVRLLLEELWHCMEPLSQTMEMLDLNTTTDNQRLPTLVNVRPERHPLRPLPASPRKKQISPSASKSPKVMKAQTLNTSGSLLKVSPEKSPALQVSAQETSMSKEERNKKPGRKKKRSLGPEDIDQCCSIQIDKADDDCDDDQSLVRDCWKTSDNLWEILDCFRPLPAALSPMPLSNELAEMEDDSSASGLKETSLSSGKDGEKSPSESTRSTNPKTLKDTVVTPSSKSSHDSNSGLLNKEMSLDSPGSGDEVPNSLLSRSEDMEVEELCVEKENVEVLPDAVPPAGQQSEHKEECVTTEPVTVITNPLPTTAKDQTNHIGILSDDRQTPSAVCNEVTSKGSHIGCKLTNTEHKHLETDKPVKSDLGTTANVTDENSERLAKTEPERTLENFQSNSTPENTTQERPSEITEKRSSFHKQAQGSSSITSINNINGSTEGSSMSEEFSDEEEFCGLKRKVRGIFSKPETKDSPENLNSDAPNMMQLVGRHKSDETTEDHPKSKTITEKDGISLQEESITEPACKVLSSKEDAVTDHLASMVVAGQQQEENEGSGALDLSVEQTDRIKKSLKEHNLKTEELNSNPQDICPPHQVLPNPATTSVMDKEENPSPLTTFTSRNALVSTPSPESLGRVRTEMGPPLPPVVMPLTQTPPKVIKHQTPVRPNVHLTSCLPSEESRSPCLTTPSPSGGVPSSPLQFGSATPKHAVPVPGRLPSSALNSSSPTASQENSMQMLDTMYPELSAQARTLNILRGNLGRGGTESGASPPSVNQISGNRTINSSSTAFTKTEQKVKRTGVNILLPKSAKKLRLDSCSPSPVNATSHVMPVAIDQPKLTEALPATNPQGNSQELRKEIIPETKRNNEDRISDAIEKLQVSCFDVLPVIKSHVFLGRISEVPVLRDEEKSVISDFCSNQVSAEELMSAILAKMKTQKAILKQEFLQSICRVYAALCRQRGDIQRAHALAYNLLKENYLEAPKLILFMVTTWPSILSYENSLCRAIHIVSKLKAEGEILEYLTAYLHWDKKPPGDIYKMVSSTLNALLREGDLKFQKHDRYGDDLCPAAWEHIFAVDLLCAHLGWKWTCDNIIGKELWPLMNTWVSQPRHQQTPVRDVCVAAVLRLIGRLCQLGIIDKMFNSVQNVAKAINLFLKHGITEGVPWEVQLTAVYAVYDLASSNPKDALEVLASWRGEITQPVPQGVTSCITQLGSLCRHISP